MATNQQSLQQQARRQQQSRASRLQQSGQRISRDRGLEPAQREQMVAEQLSEQTGEEVTREDLVARGDQFQLSREFQRQEALESLQGETQTQIGTEDVSFSPGQGFGLTQEARQQEAVASLQGETETEIEAGDLTQTESGWGLSETTRKEEAVTSLQPETQTQIGVGDIQQTDQGLQLTDAALRRESVLPAAAEEFDEFGVEDFSISDGTVQVRDSALVDTFEDRYGNFLPDGEDRDLSDELGDYYDRRTELGQSFTVGELGARELQGETETRIGAEDVSFTPSQGFGLTTQALREEAASSSEYLTPSDFTVEEGAATVQEEALTEAQTQQRQDAFDSLQGETQTDITQDDLTQTDQGFGLTESAQRAETFTQLQSGTETTIDQDDITQTESGWGLTTQAQREEAVTSLQPETDIDVGTSDITQTESGFGLTESALKEEASVGFGAEFGVGDLEVVSEDGQRTVEPTTSASLQEYRQEAAASALAAADQDLLVQTFESMESTLPEEQREAFQIEISEASMQNRSIDMDAVPEPVEDRFGETALNQGFLGLDKSLVVDVYEEMEDTLPEDERVQFQTEISEASQQNEAIDVEDLPGAAQDRLVEVLPEQFPQLATQELSRRRVARENEQFSYEDTFAEMQDGGGFEVGIEEQAQQREIAEQILGQTEGFTEPDITYETTEGRLTGSISEQAQRREVAEDFDSEMGINVGAEDIFLGEEQARLTDSAFLEWGATQYDAFAQEQLRIRQQDGERSVVPTEQARKERGVGLFQDETEMDIDTGNIILTDEGVQLGEGVSQYEAAQDMADQMNRSYLDPDRLAETESGGYRLEEDYSEYFAGDQFLRDRINFAPDGQETIVDQVAQQSEYDASQLDFGVQDGQISVFPTEQAQIESMITAQRETQVPSQTEVADQFEQQFGTTSAEQTRQQVLAGGGTVEQAESAAQSVGFSTDRAMTFDVDLGAGDVTTQDQFVGGQGAEALDLSHIPEGQRERVRENLRQTAGGTGFGAVQTETFALSESGQQEVQQAQTERIVGLFDEQLPTDVGTEDVTRTDSGFGLSQQGRQELDQYQFGQAVDRLDEETPIDITESDVQRTGDGFALTEEAQTERVAGLFDEQLPTEVGTEDVTQTDSGFGLSQQAQQELNQYVSVIDDSEGYDAPLTPAGRTAGERYRAESDLRTQAAETYSDQLGFDVSPGDVNIESETVDGETVLSPSLDTEAAKQTGREQGDIFSGVVSGVESFEEGLFSTVGVDQDRVADRLAETTPLPETEPGSVVNPYSVEEFAGENQITGGLEDVDIGGLFADRAAVGGVPAEVEVDQQALKQRSQQFDENVVQPAGEAIGTGLQYGNPFGLALTGGEAAIDTVTGNQESATERYAEGIGTGIAGMGNVFGLASSGLTVADVGVTGAQRISQGEGAEFAQAAGAAGLSLAASGTESLAENPAQMSGVVVGSVAAGYGVGAVAGPRLPVRYQSARFADDVTAGEGGTTYRGIVTKSPLADEPTPRVGFADRRPTLGTPEIEFEGPRMAPDTEGYAPTSPLETSIVDTNLRRQLEGSDLQYYESARTLQETLGGRSRLQTTADRVVGDRAKDIAEQAGLGPEGRVGGAIGRVGDVGETVGRRAGEPVGRAIGRGEATAEQIGFGVGERVGRGIGAVEDLGERTGFAAGERVGRGIGAIEDVGEGVGFAAGQRAGQGINRVETGLPDMDGDGGGPFGSPLQQAEDFGFGAGERVGETVGRVERASEGIGFTAGERVGSAIDRGETTAEQFGFRAGEPIGRRVGDVEDLGERAGFAAGERVGRGLDQIDEATGGIGTGDVADTVFGPTDRAAFRAGEVTGAGLSRVDNLSNTILSGRGTSVRGAIEESRRIPDEAVDDVTEYIQDTDTFFGGSGNQLAQIGEARTPEDIDVYTKNPNQASQELANILREHSDRDIRVRGGVEVRTDQGWDHMVDVNEYTRGMQGRKDWAGRLYKPTRDPEGTPIQSIESQVSSKVEGGLRLYGDDTVGPKTYRLKDTFDLETLGRQLGERKQQSLNPFERRRGRRATEAAAQLEEASQDLDIPGQPFDNLSDEFETSTLRPDESMGAGLFGTTESVRGARAFGFDDRGQAGGPGRFSIGDRGMAGGGRRPDADDDEISRREFMQRSGSAAVGASLLSDIDVDIGGLFGGLRQSGDIDTGQNRASARAEAERAEAEMFANRDITPQTVRADLSLGRAEGEMSESAFRSMIQQEMDRGWYDQETIREAVNRGAFSGSNIFEEARDVDVDRPDGRRSAGSQVDDDGPFTTSQTEPGQRDYVRTTPDDSSRGGPFGVSGDGDSRLYGSGRDDGGPSQYGFGVGAAASGGLSAYGVTDAGADYAGGVTGTNQNLFDDSPDSYGGTGTGMQSYGTTDTGTEYRAGAAETTDYTFDDSPDSYTTGFYGDAGDDPGAYGGTQDYGGGGDVPDYGNFGGGDTPGYGPGYDVPEYGITPYDIPGPDPYPEPYPEPEPEPRPEPYPEPYPEPQPRPETVPGLGMQTQRWPTPGPEPFTGPRGRPGPDRDGGDKEPDPRFEIDPQTPSYQNPVASGSQFLFGEAWGDSVGEDTKTENILPGGSGTPTDFILDPETDTKDPFGFMD